MLQQEKTIILTYIKINFINLFFFFYVFGEIGFKNASLSAEH